MVGALYTGDLEWDGTGPKWQQCEASVAAGDPVSMEW